MVQFWNSKGQLAARGSHTKYSLTTELPLKAGLTVYRYVNGTVTPEKPEYVAPNEFVEDETKSS
ncbi:hypothetical protein jhhlp_002752 [Lomentospora prolificans]|uniref:Uncharacterized protein n=1 Tax=Lomentospora prolificans TaxID=41688 RepID=A0A2N3NEY0_9PEZI|nr:hypothetical protein jhhlp_002752 [Lomentospora prolificans]